MREQTLRKLIRLVEQSAIESLEIWSWGRRVKITKRLSAENGQPASGGAPALPHLHVLAPTQRPSHFTPLTAAQSGNNPAVAGVEVPPEIPTDRVAAIKSPMVGTFYRAPAPDAKSYVELGQVIEKGQVVCIIEAMKLMNEIESDVAGRVVKILVENARPVEFGQPLFFVEPTG